MNQLSYIDAFQKNQKLIRGDHSNYGITLDAMHVINTFNFIDDNLYLDFGCGDGQLTLKIKKLCPKIKIIGVDIIPELIYIANKNNTYDDIKFFCLSIDQLKDIKFDGVFSFSVLQFFQYQEILKLNSILFKNMKGKSKIIHFSIPDLKKRSIVKTNSLLNDGKYFYALIYFLLKFFHLRKKYNDHGSIYLSKKKLQKTFQNGYNISFYNSNNIERFDFEISLKFVENNFI